MANTLTPTDVYTIVNEVALQATGREDLKAVDTSSFVAVGETLLRLGTENTLNALSTVLSRTIFSSRPYNARLRSLVVDSERWGAMIRKIVYFPTEAQESTDWNSDINPNTLVDGNSVDMYKINKKKAMQLNFYGTKLLQKCITRFKTQLDLAFQSESEFGQFMNAMMIEFQNDIETMYESESRATLLNYIGGISAMGLYEVDLAKEYNDKYGTSYSRDQLLTTHVESFMKFVASTIKIYSNRMEDRSALYHANLTNYPNILRHTPKARQRMIMYSPLFIEAEANVYSSLFNPQYLDIGTYEGVNFWQSQTDPTAVRVTPNILDVATGESKTADNTIELPYVLGLLHDEEALGINFQFDYASTTPFNSAGGYYNTFYHWRRNYWNDFTKNAILFVIGNGE